jgi:hypothetical protein
MFVKLANPTFTFLQNPHVDVMIKCACFVFLFLDDFLIEMISADVEECAVFCVLFFYSYFLIATIGTTRR